MVPSLFILLAAAATAFANSMSEEQLFTFLLRRQEPGTPAYNCHSNCGTAISLSKGSSDICSDDTFVSSYEKCLECAGPENFNIWRYYGRALSPVGEKCGLATEPLPGKQPDVSSTLAIEPSSIPTTNPAVPESASPTSQSSESPIATSEIQPETTGYEALRSTIAHSAPSSASSYTYTSPSISGVTTPSSNGTASFTSPPPAQFTGSAASSFQLPQFAGLFGAALLAAFHAT